MPDCRLAPDQHLDKERYISLSPTTQKHVAPCITRIKCEMGTQGKYTTSNTRAQAVGVNLVAYAKALAVKGSAMCSVQLAMGPLPVTMA